MLRSYKRSTIQYRHRAVNFLFLSRKMRRPSDNGTEPAQLSPPTLVQYDETEWTTSGTSKVTGTITWQTGDVIIIIGATEDQAVTFTPTATGLTFSADSPLTAGSTCWANSWRVTAGSGGSSVVTLTRAGSSGQYGASVWVWRGSGGVGIRATDSTAAKSVLLARGGHNSCVVAGAFDFELCGHDKLCLRARFRLERRAGGY